MKRGPKFQAKVSENGNYIDKKLNEKEKLNAFWGRHTKSSSTLGRWLSFVNTLAILTLCPIIVVYYWISCAHFQCELITPIKYLHNLGLKKFGQHYGPPIDHVAFIALGFWYLFQALLYCLLPGPKVAGQITPAGHLPMYKVNGIWAWLVSHVMLALYVYYWLPTASDKLNALTFIADHWGGLLIACNALAYLLSILVYLKAYKWPSSPLEDRKWSEFHLYDFFMGVELNPRLGRNFDLKLFHNGRPGIIAWTLINLSFAAAQYRTFGVVSNALQLVAYLQAIYALDLFCFESWYLRTLDIAHDHFGFYLAWGDLVWLPFMYTVQGYYLSRHPVQLSSATFWTLLCVGLMGYAIFRVTNNQKDGFRAAYKKGKPYYLLFGQWLPAQYVLARYKTSDGAHHTSALLTSGFWGVARHFNYTGDLILATAMCLACGTTHFYPYFYLAFMLVLLINRVFRDEDRCKAKYGSDWDTYCSKVPYRFIPYVF